MANRIGLKSRSSWVAHALARDGPESLQYMSNRIRLKWVKFISHVVLGGARVAHKASAVEKSLHVKQDRSPSPASFSFAAGLLRVSRSPLPVVIGRPRC